MDVVLAVIVPVFGAVALGFALFQCRIFDVATGDGLVRFVYYVAIPALLFRSLAHTALPAQIPFDLIAAFYLPSIALFVAGMFLARRAFGWDRPSEGIAGLGACYANLVMLGLPLATAAFGTTATIPLFTLIALQSTILFPLATWSIEIHGARGSAVRIPWTRAFGRLLLNPVIMSLALGIIANVTGYVPQGALDALLERIAQAAPGCALVSLGVSLAQYRLGSELAPVWGLLALKNILHPAAVWLACALFGVEPAWTRVAVLMAAMPSGVNAYIFARRYALREAAISQTIVLSTLTTGVVATFLLHHFLHR